VCVSLKYIIYINKFKKEKKKTGERRKKSAREEAES
jgi:hypothetical protein